MKRLSLSIALCILFAYGTPGWCPPAVPPTGNVTGPASSTDGHVVLFDGTTGKLLKDGGAVSPDNTTGPNATCKATDGDIENCGYGTVATIEAYGTTSPGIQVIGVKSTATTGIVKVTGPAAGATRTKTVSDADATVAEISQTVIYRVDSLPIGWFIDGGTAPGALSTLTLGTNKAKYRDFSGSTDNDVIFEWPVPYGIDATVTPTFQVEGWITNATGPADTETAKFTLACASYGDSDAGSGSLGTGVTVTKTFTTASAHAQYDRWVSGYSTGVTITNLADGELVLCNLKRDTTDTYAQSIGVGWIKIKYAVKLQGS